jgi:hypothetical protein
VRLTRRLQALAGDGETDELKTAMRHLIAGVKVWPNFTVEISGTLEAVTGGAPWPHGLTLGRNGGSERGT